VTLPTFNAKLSIRAKGGVAPAHLKVREANGKILLETSRALSRPGVSRRTVFTARGVGSYSVDPADPKKVVRESASGVIKIGRIVDGRFRSLRRG